MVSGMGLNAFFVYTVCIGFGLSYANALAFCMVDLFDTPGTLYAACERAGLVDENGEPLNMNQGMLSDAIATVIGAICGTSTVTTFSEVNSGRTNRDDVLVQRDLLLYRHERFLR